MTKLFRDYQSDMVFSCTKITTNMCSEILSTCVLFMWQWWISSYLYKMINTIWTEVGLLHIDKMVNFKALPNHQQNDFRTSRYQKGESNWKNSIVMRNTELLQSTRQENTETLKWSCKRDGTQTLIRLQSLVSLAISNFAIVSAFIVYSYWLGSRYRWYVGYGYAISTGRQPVEKATCTYNIGTCITYHYTCRTLTAYMTVIGRSVQENSILRRFCDMPDV